ncbi:MAG: leucyl aminopeptidase family protein [Alphaproteobacteria bacterium]|nr:leucyl aminopeptidase family protein [Alphaproteobacteria bacterium]
MPQSFYLTEKSKQSVTPIILLSDTQYEAWLKKQPPHTRAWLAATQFKASAGNVSLVPAPSGGITQVVACVDSPLNVWSIAHLATALPTAHYDIDAKLTPAQATDLALGWALSTYQFTKYKEGKKSFATLVAPTGTDMEYVQAMAESICWARDLINTPAGDMHPEALAEEAVAWAQEAKGKVRVIKGEQLLKSNYPMIYTVGKAATVPPHLVDIHFPKKGAPKITLVGKGVCFDSGGLDIKNTAGMKLMKKDMGGAANVLALAKAIIDTGLAVELRVLLPIVENAIAGNAMRPLDIIKTRKGITVEIGNTDAEGRLILCDALTEADSGKPDLLIDCATLTGAARVALGTDIPAFFTHDDALAESLSKASTRKHDPLWRLPLHSAYRSQLDSPNADLSNDPDSGYGGAITAALYLNEFVSRTTPWIHIDMMAWNPKSRPGRLVGGEAMGIRAVYSMIKERYGKR